jgi:predicted Zn-dependent peptidase
MSERITTLTNGVRVVTIEMPHIDSVSVGVFVRTGSRNESKKLNGISHFLEHMAFKGTTTRSCRDIALGVERLGAYMNAYTSKDTTCYYMNGLAKHAGLFVDMLSDMVQNNAFPADELERERGVILQEFNQYEDDAGSTAWNLYDAVSFGGQPMGMTILGPKKNIKAFTRDDFMEYVTTQYTAPNMIVGVAGNINHDDIVALVEQGFASVSKGAPNTVQPTQHQGGIKIKRKAAFTQSTVLMGFPVANLKQSYLPDLVASSVLGDGMSSPLFTDIREKRGLSYHISSGRHMMDDLGQLYVVAGTTPEHLEEFFNATCDVLQTNATTVDPIDLERAINQISVAEVRKQERPFSRIEDAAEDLFTYGHMVDKRDFVNQVSQVTADQVQQSIQRALKQMPSIAIVGKGADEKYLDQVLKRLM